MNDAILQKNITISGATDTGKQIKIKDEFGKTYSFFKTKQNGEQTQAMVQFPEYKVGEKTGISYKQVPYTLPDGKQTMLNNILGFMPVMQETVQATANIQTAKPQVALNEYQSEVKDNKFWDKKAYKQCLWNYWLEQENAEMEPLSKEEIDLVWQVFNQIEQDADKRFSEVDPSAIPF